MTLGRARSSRASWLLLSKATHSWVQDHVPGRVRIYQHFLTGYLRKGWSSKDASSVHVSVTSCVRDLPGKWFLVPVPTHPSQKRFCNHRFPKHMPHQWLKIHLSLQHLAFWVKKTATNHNHISLRVWFPGSTVQLIRARQEGDCRGSCGHRRAAGSYQPSGPNSLFFELSLRQQEGEQKQ